MDEESNQQKNEEHHHQHIFRLDAVLKKRQEKTQLFWCSKTEILDLRTIEVIPFGVCHFWNMISDAGGLPVTKVLGTYIISIY